MNCLRLQPEVGLCECRLEPKNKNRIYSEALELKLYGLRIFLISAKADFGARNLRLKPEAIHQERFIDCCRSQWL